MNYNVVLSHNQLKKISQLLSASAEVLRQLSIAQVPFDHVEQMHEMGLKTLGELGRQLGDTNWRFRLTLAEQGITNREGQPIKLPSVDPPSFLHITRRENEFERDWLSLIIASWLQSQAKNYRLDQGVITSSWVKALQSANPPIFFSETDSEPKPYLMDQSLSAVYKQLARLYPKIKTNI